MKLTLREIHDLYLEINGLKIYDNDQETVLFTGLMNQSITFKAKYALFKLSGALEKDYNYVIEQRKTLSQEDFIELLKQENEIDIKTIWPLDTNIEMFSNITTTEVYVNFYKLFEE